jgi:small subunit ribosomal protein S18
MTSKEEFNEPVIRRKRIEIVDFDHVDYKDVDLLRNFITERGKILPRRITGVSCSYQSKVKAAIKRARYVALLPFVSEE